MSLDKQIKDALSRHQDDVTPDMGAFDMVEQRIRRSHQRRVTAAGTFVVALLVAASASVIALRADREPGFSNPDDDPTPTPSPTISPFPGPDSVTFWDVTAGYYLFMPNTWRVTEFEGVVELLPQGEIGTAAGEDTFAVEIQLRMGENYEDLARAEGAGATVIESEIADRPGLVWETPGEEQFVDASRNYAIDWPSSSCRLAGCSSDPNTLLIHIISSTADRWESYGEIATAAVENLQAVVTPADVPQGPIFTRRGSIDGAVIVDDRVQFLSMFLEARVRGGGAEQYLAPGVTTQGYGMYTFDDEKNPYIDYTIESCDTSGDTSQCRVSLAHPEPDDPFCCRLVETIEVGPLDGKGLKILSIVEDGASPPGGP